MKYDFIEIGSCDFDTILQACGDEETGITVEPIRKYLDNLPDRQNVKKVCAAVVSELSEDINVYYVDADKFDDDQEYWPGKGLPHYLKGCNSVSKPHDYHVACPEKLWVAQSYGKDYVNMMKTYNLLEAGLVKVEKCRCITFSNLVEEYDIDYVNKIKLDTEGQDCILLESILDFYEKSKIKYPRNIQFETNLHNDPDEVDKICNRLSELGYEIEGWDGKNYLRDRHDCTAVLRDSIVINETALNKNQIKRIEELKQIHRMHDGWKEESSYVNGLINLIEKYISSDFILCEIGSYRGVSSEVFAIFSKKLFCVDIWDGLRNPGDTHPLSPEMQFDIMCSSYENIIKIKNKSSEASKEFEDNSLDAVYIDGDHSFDGFTEDMVCWIPKVKNGGYVMGHDWRIISEWIDRWIDPTHVEVFIDDSWIFKKSNQNR